MRWRIGQTNSTPQIGTARRKSTCSVTWWRPSGSGSEETSRVQRVYGPWASSKVAGPVARSVTRSVRGTSRRASAASSTSDVQITVDTGGA